MLAAMSRFLAVAAGGALGSMARYAIGLMVAGVWKREFPLATFLIKRWRKPVNIDAPHAVHYTRCPFGLG